MEEQHYFSLCLSVMLLAEIILALKFMRKKISHSAKIEEFLKNVNLYQQSESRNLIGCQLEVGVAS